MTYWNWTTGRALWVESWELQITFFNVCQLSTMVVICNCILQQQLVRIAYYRVVRLITNWFILVLLYHGDENCELSINFIKYCLISHLESISWRYIKIVVVFTSRLSVLGKIKSFSHVRFYVTRGIVLLLPTHYSCLVPSSSFHLLSFLHIFKISFYTYTPLSEIHFSPYHHYFSL